MREDTMNNMDTNMEDVETKMPEQHQIPSGPAEPISIPTLDGWVANLMDCKQLAEQDVQRLCDKVCVHSPKDFQLDRRVSDSRQGELTRKQAREVLQEESNVQPVVCTAPIIALSLHNLIVLRNAQ